jgi:zinc transport system substrate-binding protein
VNKVISVLVCLLLSIAVGFNTLAGSSFNNSVLDNNISSISVNSDSGINKSNNIQLNETNANTKIKVVASFYPIYEFVKKVGGDRVEASSLIPLGASPHEFEPTIQQIQNAETVDMLVYNGGGLEGTWIKRLNAKFVVDTSQGLNLTKNIEYKQGQLLDGQHQKQPLYDPHIWLDPILAKQQVAKIRDGLIKIDPTNASYYKENAKRFMSQLDSLDASIRSDLSKCKKRDFVAFHNAFSYFSNRYGLIQHSIYKNSISEGELSPQRLQQIIETARNLGLHIIYAEDIIDPRLANVIAQEIPNGKVLILSPLEGIDKEEQKSGIGYLEKMKENISNLKMGLDCSTN